MQVVTNNSSKITENEQKIAIVCRELTAIVFAAEIYEFLVFGSKHAITIFTDHKPILSLLARKAHINFLFFRYQIVCTRFQELVFFWTQAQIFFAHLPRKSFPTKLLQHQQKLHKTIPTSVEFHRASSKDLSKVYQNYYVIKGEPIESSNSINSFAIYCENGKDKIILQMFDNGHKKTLNHLPKIIFLLKVCFILKDDINKNNLKVIKFWQTDLHF